MEPVIDAMDDIYPRTPLGATDDPVANALKERGISPEQMRHVTSKELPMSSAAFQNR
jgi:hypothetical protein